MESSKGKSLFTAMTEEESAAVSGGCLYIGPVTVSISPAIITLDDLTTAAVSSGLVSQGDVQTYLAGIQSDIIAANANPAS